MKTFHRLLKRNENKSDKNDIFHLKNEQGWLDKREQAPGQLSLAS